MKENSARSYGLPLDYEGEYNHLVSRMLGGSSEAPRRPGRRAARRAWWRFLAPASSDTALQRDYNMGLPNGDHPWFDLSSWSSPSLSAAAVARCGAA
jgi:hypothetical protein